MLENYADPHHHILLDALTSALYTTWGVPENTHTPPPNRDGNFEGRGYHL